mgnify:CR=1 FL=1
MEYRFICEKQQNRSTKPKTHTDRHGVHFNKKKIQLNNDHHL